MAELKTRRGPLDALEPKAPTLPGRSDVEVLRRRLDEWRQLLRQAPATAQRLLGLLLSEPITLERTAAGIRLGGRIAHGPVFLGMAGVNAVVPPG